MKSLIMNDVSILLTSFQTVIFRPYFLFKYILIMVQAYRNVDKKASLLRRLHVLLSIAKKVYAREKNFGL